MKARTGSEFFDRVKSDIIKESRKAPRYRRVSKAARVAAYEMDSAIAINRRHEFACSKGCSYCCHLHTDITTGEALVLAEAVRAMPEERRDDVVRRLHENSETLKGMSYTQRLEAAIPCALLDLNSNTCSVYDSRPTNCRKWHSLSVSACKYDCENPSNEKGVPQDPLAMNAATLVYEAYKDAMKHPMGELHQGVLMALDPDAEKKLCQGVPVFAGWTETNESATEEELSDVKKRAAALAEVVSRIFPSRG